MLLTVLEACAMARFFAQGQAATGNGGQAVKGVWRS
jgi:hypothetical protein